MLLETAARVKRERAEGVRSSRFAGMTIALLFEKRSTRTRCAFETAFGEEGGYPVFLSRNDIHLGAKESVEDTARVLGRMFDAVQYRGHSQGTAELLANHAGVPVYNGLTDMYHPTQALADLLTMRERFGFLKGLRLSYVGDGRNNVASSLIIAAAKSGIRLAVASPDSLKPSEELMQKLAPVAASTGGAIVVSSDARSAVEGADVIYTDVWTSMGEEDRESERTALLWPFQVNQDLMNRATEGAIFLHCLPAIKGNEVSAEVIEGPSSAVWDQAENRKHTIKAVMIETLGT